MRTFVLAPALARSSCRSSGVAGWAERDLGRQRPDFDVCHEGLRVRQDRVGDAARRAQLVPVHVLRLLVSLVDAPAAIEPPAQRSRLLDGDRDVGVGAAGEEASHSVDVARQPEEDGAERAARDAGRELRAGHEGLGVQHLDRRPADSRVRSVESPVDGPLVGRNAGLRRSDEHQGDADDRQNREHQDRDHERGAALLPPAKRGATGREKTARAHQSVTAKLRRLTRSIWTRR